MFVLRFTALAAVLALFAVPAFGQVDGPVRSVAFNDYYNGGGGCAGAGCSDPGCASCGDAGCATPCSCGGGCADGCCGGGCGGLGGFGLLDGVCNFSLNDLLLGSDSAITVGGWTQLGYHNKSTALLSPQTSLSFNNRPGELNLHQQWLYAEKVADGSNGLDLGFRADLMYGIDGTDTQAFGNPPGEWDFLNGFDHGAYSWAVPQAYVQVASGDLSVIAGKFFTIVGYEVVTAPDNFFYSHAFTMFNSEPFTHTGVLASYDMGGATLYGGWTLGWDTGFNNFNGGSNFLGGFSVPVMEDITVTYITTAGNFGWRGDNGYSHSVVADVTLTENLNYVFQSDLVDANSLGAPAGVPSANGLNDDSVGINQYMFYALNDVFSLGSRWEWWKSDGLSHHAGTYGVNVRACENVIFRPEIRHQWAPGLDTDTTVFGMDGILTY